MSMFLDSPIDYCPMADRYVLMDQTQEACARENGCLGDKCPLAAWFNRNPKAPPAKARKGSIKPEPGT